LNLELLTRLASELEGETLLEERSSLQQRLEALNCLEAYLLPLSVAPLEPGCTEAAIYDRLTAIQSKLEAINFEVYDTIRRDIRRGHGRNGLLRWLPHLDTFLRLNHSGYDYLDDVITGVLQFEEPEATTVQPTAEMVFYQPTPARHIFDLLERTALTEEDVLVDIGSGLGHVPILTSIWTNARSVGLEIESVYVACARQVMESLNLKRVTFIEENALAADFESGTVFYLYTPFTGTMLRTALDSLCRKSNTRAIRICTFGPCTPVMAAEDWLDAVGEVRPDRISVFRSRLPR
jgi:Histone methylation protein DOT1